MPPKIALLICYVFVFWSIWRDSRTNPYSGKALWIPTIWMIRCASRNIDFWLGGGEDGRVDPILLLILSAAGFVALTRRQCEWRQLIARNGALFLFYFYMAISLTWADALQNPAIKIMRPLGDLIMALVVVTETNPRLAIITLFRRTAIPLIPISIMLIKYFPYLGKMEDKHWGSDMWIGVTTHKNPLGQLCMVATLGFIWTILDSRRAGIWWRRQKLNFFYLVLTGYLFFGGSQNSRSTTAIFCTGIALVFFFSLGRMRHQVDKVTRRIMLATFVVSLVAVVLQVAGTSLQAVTAEAQGKNADLTGRTILWQDVVRIGMEHPFIGSGYGGFWVPSIYSKLSPAVDNSPAEAHNGYLETFANLGLIGVLLLLCVILQSLRTAAQDIQIDFEYGRMRLALLFSIIIMNYSEAAFPRGTHLWWFGFLVVALSTGTVGHAPFTEASASAQEFAGLEEPI
jgi:exopolysaccharide production protein ExoQ